MGGERVRAAQDTSAQMGIAQLGIALTGIAQMGTAQVGLRKCLCAKWASPLFVGGSADWALAPGSDYGKYRNQSLPATFTLRTSEPPTSPARVIDDGFVVLLSVV